MEKPLSLALSLLISLTVSAQVSFSARVVSPEPMNNNPMFIRFGSFRLTVEGEDTLRYCRCDTNATIRFDNIRSGSRCALSFRHPNFNCTYSYPAFTVTSDTVIDSLKLRRGRFLDERFFRTKTEKDSTLESLAKGWSHNMDGHDTIRYDGGFYLDPEPNSLQLARLYYADWVSPIASWRTWPNAADSAYRYCLHAYNSHPYLYYPLRQLAHRLGKSFEIGPQEAPDKHTYFPQPEMPDVWWADSTLDLFSPWEEHTEQNYWNNNYTLGLVDEISLCYPLATDGTIRLMEDIGLGGTVIYRVEDGIIHRIYLSKHNEKVIRKEHKHYALTPDELDSVSMAIDNFRCAGRPDNESGPYVIDGTNYFLEYIVDGHYHLYLTSDGAVPSQLDALKRLLWRIYQRKQ
ncbi:MAG: hypothetical protein K5867_00215 [Bacteroidales bacterium]|nr:hypothetical protein [Bacteroidales bacterium]